MTRVCRPRLAGYLIAGVLLAGCFFKPVDAANSATEAHTSEPAPTSSTDSTAGPTSGTDTQAASTQEPTSGGDPTGQATSTGDSASSASSSGVASSGDTSSGGASSGGADKLPNGAACETDDECASMNCYSGPQAGGDGYCSECNEDADCVEFGTGISCTFEPGSFAVCEDGSVGDQCMSQDACMDGLFCAAIIDLPGLVPEFCGECATSGDCTDGDICAPTLEPGAYSGHRACVEPGSAPNDSLCPHDQIDGDAACMSGHCGTVSVMGIVDVGVCGECDDASDCMGGVCQPGTFDMGEPNGSECI